MKLPSYVREELKAEFLHFPEAFGLDGRELRVCALKEDPGGSSDHLQSDYCALELGISDWQQA